MDISILHAGVRQGDQEAAQVLTDALLEQGGFVTLSNGNRLVQIVAKARGLEPEFVHVGRYVLNKNPELRDSKNSAAEK